MKSERILANLEINKRKYRFSSSGKIHLSIMVCSRSPKPYMDKVRFLGGVLKLTKGLYICGVPNYLLSLDKLNTMPYKDKGSPKVKEKMREYRNKWYHANKDKQLKKQKERVLWNKEIIRRYKSIFLRCTDCTLPFRNKPYLCDFHHLNPKDKKDTIGNMATYSNKSLREELKKCIPLCANCHRERHADTP